ncbi:hypothetical protein [Halorubrum halodurans]|nr:hypothetical protein [Halorubrum halodurans]
MKYRITAEIDGTATADAVRELLEGLPGVEVTEWDYTPDMVFTKDSDEK